MSCCCSAAEPWQKTFREELQMRLFSFSGDCYVYFCRFPVSVTAWESLGKSALVCTEYRSVRVCLCCTPELSWNILILLENTVLQHVAGKCSSGLLQTSKQKLNVYLINELTSFPLILHIPLGLFMTYKTSISDSWNGELGHNPTQFKVDMPYLFYLDN